MALHSSCILASHPAGTGSILAAGKSNQEEKKKMLFFREPAVLKLFGVSALRKNKKKSCDFGQRKLDLTLLE